MKDIIRMCSVCRERLPKSQLVRFVRMADGNIFLEDKKRLYGRGAYICKNPKCVEMAKKKKSLERSFKCAVPEGLYRSLLP